MDLIASGIILFCSYMTYRGLKKNEAINERVTKRGEEYQRRFKTGDYTSIDELIDELDKKYKTITLRANFKENN